jgi:hypothetical protein
MNTDEGMSKRVRALVQSPVNKTDSHDETGYSDITDQQ